MPADNMAVAIHQLDHILYEVRPITIYADVAPNKTAVAVCSLTMRTIRFIIKCIKIASASAPTNPSSTHISRILLCGCSGRSSLFNSVICSWLPGKLLETPIPQPNIGLSEIFCITMP